MNELMFSKETYEMDLAIAMLESLFKKKAISLNTFRNAKKLLREKVSEDECDKTVRGTAKTVISFKEL